MTIFYELDGKLYLNLTNRCTNACEFCIRDYDEGISPDINLWIDREPSAEEIAADSKRFDMTKYPEVTLCGYGEPLLRLDTAVAACKYLKRTYGCKIRINTNGLASAYHKTNVPPLFSGLADVFSVSLNQKDAPSYDALCHSQFGLSAFDEIVNFAREAKKYIPRVIMTVVDVIPAEDIAECKKTAEALGAEFRVRAKI